MVLGGYASLMLHAGYRAVVATQFLGALNDNILRIVVCLYALSPAIGAEEPSLWIALGGFAFIAPYLLFAGHAGRISDVVPKRSVMIGAKVAELAIMGAAFVAFDQQNLAAMTGVLFLMATQSAYFSPARYSILPEMLAPADLGRANGLGEMSMFAAIVIGMGLGGYLFDIADGAPAYVALPILLIAAIGLVTSVLVPADRSHRIGPPTGSAVVAHGGLRHGLRLLRRSPALAAGVAGMSFFWFFGSLLQIDVLFLGAETLGLDQTGIGLLQGTLGLGVGAGGLVAGRMIDRIPMARLAQSGAILLMASLFLVVLAPSGRGAAFAGLFMAGCGGGAFIVPIIVVLQTRCDPAGRGSLFALNNLFNMAAVLIGVALFWLLNARLGMSPEDLLRLLAVSATAVLAVLAFTPGCVARFIRRRSRVAALDLPGKLP